MRNRFEEFVACAVEINRCIQRIKDQEMQRFGLRSRHTMCLYFLGCHPEGLSVGALADLTKEDKAAVSRCLGQLAERVWPGPRIPEASGPTGPGIFSPRRGRPWPPA